MISVDEVKKIARLSCLELSEEETEQYAKEFNTILEHFEVLKTAELVEEVKEQSIHLPGEGREDDRPGRQPTIAHVGHDHIEVEENRDGHHDAQDVQAVKMKEKHHRFLPKISVPTLRMDSSRFHE